MTETKTSMDEKQLKIIQEKMLKSQSTENTAGRVRDIKDIVRWFNLNGIGIPEDKR